MCVYMQAYACVCMYVDTYAHVCMCVHAHACMWKGLGIGPADSHVLKRPRQADFT